MLYYFHATEYLALTAEMGFKRKFEGKEWLKKACHKLKHEEFGAKAVLCLRCLNKSDGKWSQLWDKINKYGT